MSPNESSALLSVQKAFLGFDKRAEKISDEILEATFVDSAPFFDILSSRNNQIIYGRRGTGKTHALKYLARRVEKDGDIPIYVDLRSIGSNGSIYSDGSKSLAERAATLIRDVLETLNNEFYSISVAALSVVSDPNQVTIRLDDFTNSISHIKITGEISVEDEDHAKISGSSKYGLDGKLEVSGLSGGASFSTSENHENSSTGKIKRSGVERIHLNFGSISTAMNGLIQILGGRRLWLLVDEWSEVPFDLQPYLADLFRRIIIPSAYITVKIAAIEHRSMFSLQKDKGEYIGLELGADVAADLNLDDFLVFDSNKEKSTEFFKSLLFKHFTQSNSYDPEVTSPSRLVQLVFTQFNVFEEFVTAVEGVPRDALNLAAKMTTKAYGNKTAMNHVRAAARDWYTQDKQAVIKSNKNLQDLLTKIIDDVIGSRKARAFLFLSNYRHDLIDKLFDARLLHVLKRNISAHDEPGVRYDVYKIDYGCYVELINTNKMPQGLFSAENSEGDVSFVEVPRDDYRSIRGAILRPDALDVPF